MSRFDERFVGVVEVGGMYYKCVLGICVGEIVVSCSFGIVVLCEIIEWVVSFFKS